MQLSKHKLLDVSKAIKMPFATNLTKNFFTPCIHKNAEVITDLYVRESCKMRMLPIWQITALELCVIISRTDIFDYLETGFGKWAQEVNFWIN